MRGRDRLTREKTQPWQVTIKRDIKGTELPWGMKNSGSISGTPTCRSFTGEMSPQNIRL